MRAVTLISNIIMASLFVGCTTTKEVVYEPYPSSYHIYKNTLEKNRMSWKAELIDDMNIFTSFTEDQIARIDNHKTYMATTHNVEVLPTKEEPKVESRKLKYDDIILEREYGY